MYRNVILRKTNKIAQILKEFDDYYLIGYYEDNKYLYKLIIPSEIISEEDYEKKRIRKIMLKKMS